KLQLKSEANRPLIRQEIVHLLGSMGSRAGQAVPQLIELLEEGQPDGIREAAVVALGDIGCASTKVRAALVDFWLSATGSLNKQIQAATALCKLKIDASGLLSFLTATLMTNQDADLRQSAAQALAFCSKNGIDVVPALLLAAVKDKAEEVRRTAEAGLTQ